MRRALVAIVALLALASGCVVPLNGASTTTPTGAATIDADWAKRALVSGSAHDHYDPAQHKGLSTPNFHVLGWDPLATDAKKGMAAGGYSCGELGTTTEGRKLAVVNSFTSDVMFVVVDITDAAAPKKVGEFVLPEGHAYDVALTPDGTHVLIAQNNVRRGSLGLMALPTDAAAPVTQPFFRDACGREMPLAPDPQIDALPGVLLVSIKDPAKPVMVDGFFGGFGGPHSVATSQVDNVTYAVVSALQGAHYASVFEFFTVEGDKLVFQSAFQAPPMPGQTPVLLNGHMDGTIAKHPVTNQRLAYLADWNGGLVIVDVSNIRAPVMLSSYSETTDPAAFIDEGGAIHDVLPIEGTWDGKHYVLAGQELTAHPKGRPTGWVFIVDDTDPAHLKIAGRWTLPADSEWNGYLAFSLHYTVLVNRTLFVSAYHAGVWAVDLSTPEAIAAPPTLGVFIPDRANEHTPATKKGDGQGTPDVEDILAQSDGTLVTFDAASGVYTLRFDPQDPSVPALPAWKA